MRKLLPLLWMIALVLALVSSAFSQVSSTPGVTKSAAVNIARRMALRNITALGTRPYGVVASLQGYIPANSGAPFLSREAAGSVVINTVDTMVLEYRVPFSLEGFGLFVSYPNWGKTSGSLAARWNETGPGNAVTVEMAYLDRQTSTWVQMREVFTQTTSYSCPNGETCWFYAPIWVRKVTDANYPSSTVSVGAQKLRLKVTAAGGNYIVGLNKFNVVGDGAVFWNGLSTNSPPSITTSSALNGFANNANASSYLTFPLSFSIKNPSTTAQIIQAVWSGDSQTGGSQDIGTDWDVAGGRRPAYWRRAMHGFNESQTTTVLTGLNFGVSGDQGFYNAPGDSGVFGAIEPWVRHHEILQAFMPRLGFWAYGVNDAANGRTIATMRAAALATTNRWRALGVEKVVGVTGCPYIPTTTDTVGTGSAYSWHRTSSQTLPSQGITAKSYSDDMVANPSLWGFDYVIDLRQAIGDASDRDKWGHGTTVALTVTGGSTNTVAYLNGTGVNDLTTKGRYNDYIIQFTSATNATNVGTFRRVNLSDFSSPNHRLFPTVNYAANIVAGDGITVTPNYTNDGIHLNGVGSAVAAAYVQTELSTIISRYFPVP